MSKGHNIEWEIKTKGQKIKSNKRRMGRTVLSKGIKDERKKCKELYILNGTQCRTGKKDERTYAKSTVIKIR
jgi:hypothetical protein